VFQQATIVGIGLLLVLSVALGQPALILFCVVLLAIAAVAWAWSNLALARVVYERQLTQQRAFPGDEIELVIRISNRKLLPLALLRVVDRYPPALRLLHAPVLFSGATQSQVLQRQTSLRWYEGVVWRYTMRCEARGAYRIGPVQLLSGDPFGIYRNDRDVHVETRLLVYPRLLGLDELDLPARNPLGDLRVGNLLRDPLRVVGVRDYAPGDPLKDVHWAATARTGSLQTRIYEPTTSRVLALFLDLDTFEYYYEGIDPEQVERMISVAATLSRSGLEAGYSVGLYVNGAPAEYEHLARLPPGRNPLQLELMMETLARLTPYSITTMSRLLATSGRDLHPGTTIVLIGSVNSEAIRAALLRQRELGFRVAWLYMGADPPPQVPGVQIHQVPAALRSA
jgi:uncharacterized protein (DUF58 family)